MTIMNFQTFSYNFILFYHTQATGQVNEPTITTNEKV